MIKNKLSLFVKLLVFFCVFITFAYYALFVNHTIMLPIASLLLIISAFILAMSKINNDMLPVFELGPFYALVVSIYALFPLVFYILNGMKFSFLSDERLFTSSPTPSEMAAIAWYYVAYLFFFTASYSLLRAKKLPPRNITETKSNKCDGVFFGVTVFFYVLLLIFFAVLAKVYHINEAASYGDTYLIIWQLPTFLRQINNHLISIKMTLQLILLVGLMMNFNKSKYILFAWLFFEVINTSLALHSRSGMMFLLLSAILAYNYYVKPIKKSTIFIMMLSMLLLFTLLGQLRSSSDIVLQLGALSILTHNEFEAVFATLYHVSFNTISNLQTIDISLLSIWTSDILNLFPQQILPFEKVDLSFIYTKNYIPALFEIGGNFPGGTLLEAMLGLGMIDACLKGLVVGILFAYVYRDCLSNKNSFFKSVLILWITVLSYKTFSRGTFMLIPTAFYDFLIPFAGISIISKIIKGAVRNVNRPLSLQHNGKVRDVTVT